MKDFYASIAHNCQIADARYANPIDHDDLGQWLCQRESVWEKLEDQPYQPIIT